MQLQIWYCIYFVKWAIHKTSGLSPDIREMLQIYIQICPGYIIRVLVKRFIAALVPYAGHQYTVITEESNNSISALTQDNSKLTSLGLFRLFF